MSSSDRLVESDPISGRESLNGDFCVAQPVRGQQSVFDRGSIDLQTFG